MATNIEVYSGDQPVIIYLPDGTEMRMEPNTSDSFQLIENGFCSISETLDADQSDAEEFAQAMAAYWQGMWDRAKERAQQPQATPV